MKKKIAILGTAPSKAQAPYNNSTWEIWGCNISCFSLDRWDRLFEIHRKWDMDQSLWDHDHKDYFKRLKAVKAPKQVISTLPIGGPANLVIDREKLFAKYGKIWFSSSIAYMLAWALEQKPKEIGIWGIDMESREEYVVQFSGCRHFIDLARALGIKVTMPDSCLLLRDPPAYPDRFETLEGLTYEVKARWLQKVIDQNKDALWETVAQCVYDEQMVRINRFREAIERDRGALMMMQQMKRLFVWNVLPPDSPDVTSEDADDPGPV